MSYWKKRHPCWDLNPCTSQLTIPQKCTEPQYVPGTVLGAVTAYLTKAPGQHYEEDGNRCPYFIDEEAEAQGKARGGILNHSTAKSCP